MRIKQLLYEEGFTIAGAKKRLEAELSGKTPTPATADGKDGSEEAPSPGEHDALLEVREGLRDLLTLLERGDKA